MKPLHYLLAASCLLAAIVPLSAQDREVTEEQQAAITSGGEVVAEAIRPENLTDLTKGEGLPPSKNKPMIWHLGPTGITCIMSGGAVGDQLQVQGTLPGSPADGKFLWGDVITGINGRKFEAGGNLGIVIGNAIWMTPHGFVPTGAKLVEHLELPSEWNWLALMRLSSAPAFIT